MYRPFIFLLFLNFLGLSDLEDLAHSQFEPQSLYQASCHRCGKCLTVGIIEDVELQLLYAGVIRCRNLDEKPVKLNDGRSKCPTSRLIQPIIKGDKAKPVLRCEIDFDPVCPN
jgi:hypothetical protein